MNSAFEIFMDLKLAKFCEFLNIFYFRQIFDFFLENRFFKNSINVQILKIKPFLNSQNFLRIRICLILTRFMK